MPITAGDPYGTFRFFQDYLNGVLCRTITQHRLIWIVVASDPPEALLSFREHGHPVSAPIGANLYLELSQVLRAERVAPGGSYILRTVKYRYAVSRDDTLQSDPIFRFEYESLAKQPDFPYCRNHLHLHTNFDGALDGIAPSELHIPTGWVTIESVIKFLITEFELAPLSIGWRQVLEESEKQFKQWTARDV